MLKNVLILLVGIIGSVVYGITFFGLAIYGFCATIVYTVRSKKDTYDGIPFWTAFAIEWFKYYTRLGSALTESGTETLLELTGEKEDEA